jgi:hypothetical protein
VLRPGAGIRSGWRWAFEDPGLMAVLKAIGSRRLDQETHVLLWERLTDHFWPNFLFNPREAVDSCCRPSGKAQRRAADPAALASPLLLDLGVSTPDHLHCLRAGPSPCSAPPQSLSSGLPQCLQGTSHTQVATMSLAVV